MGFADASMKIIIGSDVQGAVAGLKTVDASLKTTASQTLPFFGSAIADAKEKVETLTAKLYVLNEAGLKSDIGKNLSSQLKAAREDLKGLETQAGITGEKVTSFLGTNAKARVAFIDLGRIVTDQGFSLRAIAQNFTLFNPLVVVGAAAVGLLAASFINLIEKETDAERAQKLLSTTIAESAAGQQGEISQIRDLIGIISNETNARSLRESAFKKLQDEYPNAFKNMSLEKTSLEDITKATTNLTNALVRQAEIKGLESAITDVYKKIAEESVKTGIAATDNVDKIKAALLSFGSGGVTNQASVLLSNLIKFGEQTKADNIKTFQAQVGALNDELKKLLTTSLQLGDDSMFGSSTGRGIDENTARLRVLEEIKKATDELNKPSSLPLFRQQDQAIDPKNINIEILRQKIADAIQGGIKDPANKDAFAQLADVLNQQLQKALNPDLKTNVSFELQSSGVDVDKEVKKFWEDSGKDLDERMKRLPPLKTDIKIHPTITLDEKILADLSLQLDQIIRNTIENGIGALSDSISNILTGSGGFGDIIKALGKTLGEGLKEVGQIVIKAGVEALAIQKAIAALKINPALTIAIGAALEIAGGVIENLASKKIGATAFAQGGIVTGPTFSLIGEAGPEAVLPLDKLSRFIKGANTSTNFNHYGEFKVRGADLILALARANKNRNLV